MEAQQWTIRGLKTDHIKIRCAPGANVSHLRLIGRHLVRRSRTPFPQPPDPTDVYVYEYQSQCHPNRAPYVMTIAHTTLRGLVGTCTCPFVSPPPPPPAAGDPIQSVPRDWCKHLCAAGLDLADPALKVSSMCHPLYGRHPSPPP
jgi:hypothetical protein